MTVHYNHLKGNKIFTQTLHRLVHFDFWWRLMCEFHTTATTAPDASVSTQTYRQPHSQSIWVTFNTDPHLWTWPDNQKFCFRRVSGAAPWTLTPHPQFVWDTGGSADCRIDIKNRVKGKVIQKVNVWEMWGLASNTKTCDSHSKSHMYHVYHSLYRGFLGGYEQREKWLRVWISIIQKVVIWFSFCFCFLFLQFSLISQFLLNIYLLNIASMLLATALYLHVNAQIDSLFLNLCLKEPNLIWWLQKLREICWWLLCNCQQYMIFFWGRGLTYNPDSD